MEALLDVVKVEAEDGHHLHLEFENGEKRIFDIRPIWTNVLLLPCDATNYIKSTIMKKVNSGLLVATDICLSLNNFLFQVFAGCFLTLLVPPAYSQNSSQPVSAIDASGQTAIADRSASLDRGVECKLPEYPSESQFRDESGTVRVSYFINIDGIVEQSNVETTSGFDALDKAALIAFSHCKFKTAIVNGRPVGAWTTIRFKWEIPQNDVADAQKQIYAQLYAVQNDPVNKEPKFNVPSASSRIIATDPPARCFKPVYPLAALENGEIGTVALVFLVDINGRVVDVRLTRSSGYSRLDQAAIAGLITCKLKPAIVGGNPVSVWVPVDYNWAFEELSAANFDRKNPCKSPEYPTESLKLRESGKSTIGIKVGRHGEVLESVVQKSSGYPRLDEAVRSAYILCKYIPRKEYDYPVEAWIAITHIWNLP